MPEDYMLRLTFPRQQDVLVMFRLKTEASTVP
jgi:hypothetical protein